MKATGRRTLLLGVVAMSVAAGCSSTTHGGITAGSSQGTTTTTASTGGSTPGTGAATTSTVAASVTTATSPATSTTTAASATCTTGGIPGGATDIKQIMGDIDGDLHNDTVTSYSLNGVPHVHAHLFSGKDSDTPVQIGFGTTVDISFNDFDHSAGAPKPPPVAVLAIGHTKAGTAQFTFLTLTTKYCIRPWHVNANTVFVGEVSAEGPYSGLTCEGAMGHVYTSLVSAEQAPGVNQWKITTQVLHHNFTTIKMDPAQTNVITATENDVRHQYGDIVGCGIDPLFP